MNYLLYLVSWLRSFLLQEQFVQDAAIENLRIESDVQEILNQAMEVTEEAAANAILIGARAVANVSQQFCTPLIILYSDSVVAFSPTHLLLLSLPDASSLAPLCSFFSLPSFSSFL